MTHEELEQHPGGRVTSNLGWDVEVVDRLPFMGVLRYRDSSVEAKVEYEDGDTTRYIYSETLEVLSGSSTPELEQLILDRVVRANHAFGFKDVRVQRPRRGWERRGANTAVDLDAEGRSATLQDSALIIIDGKREADVPVERTAENEYVIHWRSARTKGKWKHDEFEAFAVYALWALGATNVGSEG